MLSGTGRARVRRQCAVEPVPGLAISSCPRPGGRARAGWERVRVQGLRVWLVGQPDQRPIVSASVVVDVGALAEAIDIELQAGGSPQRAEKEQAYLKSTLRHYGTSVPSIRAVAKATSRRHADVTHDQLVALVEVLWAEPVHERRMACVELLDLYCDRLGPPDIALLERFLRESRTWALVDGLAASVVGRLVERYPELTAVLDRWAADSDFWLRRSALLALLTPLRQGRGDFDRFGRYADAMLDEHEFFVRKAIGWVLRDTGRKRPDLVYEWLLQRAARASAVTIREAVKPLSAAQRAAIVAAR
jgi:3-methyladenine DNA glycosylase AlkD